MKKNISFVLVLLIAVTCIFTLTGCQENNNVELTALAKERVSNTYWRWVDTSATANNVKVYYYAHIDADGTYSSISYTHEGATVIDKPIYGNSEDATWEIIMYKGRPCVKISEIINDIEDTDYILMDVDNEGNITNLYKNMYIYDDRYYDENSSYIMTELTQAEYNEEIAEKEDELAKNSKSDSVSGSSGSFTNSFGTKTTKCAHSGCSNYIASSGDTNCCTKHSKNCLNCGCFIDEDAMYCMSCIESVLK